MEELAGKTAVVTGGASGIGLALARAFLAEGMRVVIADIEKDALDRAQAELDGGGDVVGIETDVTDWSSVENLAGTTFDHFGACHLLVNNAGVGAPSSTVWETTVNDWRWVHGVNVMGVVHGIQAFVPRMIASGESRLRREHLIGRRWHRANGKCVRIRGQQGCRDEFDRVSCTAVAVGGHESAGRHLLPFGRSAPNRIVDR